MRVVVMAFVVVGVVVSVVVVASVVVAVVATRHNMALANTFTLAC